MITFELHTNNGQGHYFLYIGIVVGGGLVVGGIAAAPFTFGASIGLAAAGAAVGAAASLGGVSALIARRVMENKHLKKAQEHVRLDQQMSINVNECASEYSEKVQEYTANRITSGVSSSIGTAASIGGRIGMVSAIAAEGVVESTAVALRTAGRVAGMAVAGASLAVTIPIDLGFIAYHSYNIHTAKGDESGAKEKDPFVKWFMQQTEALLKGSSCIMLQFYLILIRYI